MASKNSVIKSPQSICIGNEEANIPTKRSVVYRSGRVMETPLFYPSGRDPPDKVARSFRFKKHGGPSLRNLPLSEIASTHHAISTESNPCMYPKSLSVHAQEFVFTCGRVS